MKFFRINLKKEGIAMKAKRFEDLIVWQKAHKLVLAIYKLTRAFPRDELFGLTSQIRRAAVSVPANIAEGFKRKGRADKLRFFNISQGSLEEVRYYLILANDLEYGETEELKGNVDEVGRLLDAYMKSIAKK
jgi:four helix bundle protein